jgi:sec-independent protein translocase protein TatB
MFDIGFSEVLLIFVIALVVLGPEKLPRLASQVGRWIGRARAMARQFREQLEEEVNLENVRKAHEQKPKAATTADASSPGEPPSATSETVSPNPMASPGAAEGERAHGADQAGTQPYNVQAHDAQPQLGETSASSSAYSGPDPADFRADTFSHAHPTNEYGANPYTASGAAEEAAPAHAAPGQTAPVESGSTATGAAPAAQSQFSFESQTPSEANVAAAQPQSEAQVERHVAADEAYAPRSPRDNTPGTDNHGN